MMRRSVFSLRERRLLKIVGFFAMIFLPLGVSCYADTLWQKVNGGYPIDAGGSLGNPGYGPNDYSVESVRSSDGMLIYLFNSGRFNKVTGRFNTETGNWEIWTCDGWSGESDALPEPMSQGLFRDGAVRLHALADGALMGLVNAREISGRALLDVHGHPDHVRFDQDAGWRRWNGAAGYSRFGVGSIIRPWGGVGNQGLDFAFNEISGQGILVTVSDKGRSFFEYALTAARYDSSHALPWENWRNGWIPYSQAYRFIVNEAPPGGERLVAPRIAWIPNTPDFLVTFDHALSEFDEAGLGAFLYRGASETWVFWDGENWRSEAPYTYGHLIATDGVAARRMLARADGVVFTYQSVGAYVVEIIYDANQEIWSSQIVTPASHKLFAANMDAAGKIWLAYANGDQQVYLKTKIADTWSAPELIYTSTSDRVLPHDINFISDGTPILFVIEERDDQVRLFGLTPEGLSDGAVERLDVEVFTGSDRFQWQEEWLLETAASTTAPGQLYVDQRDVLYVPHVTVKYVAGFSPGYPDAGSHVFGASGSLSGWSFNMPSAVAEDPVRQRLYIAHRLVWNSTPNGRILVFDGQQFPYWATDWNPDEQEYTPYVLNGGFRWPGGLAVYTGEEERYLYVADSQNNRVRVYDITSDGPPVFVRDLGSEGTSDGAFQFPTAVAVDKGCLYVVDSMNHRIQAFDHEGHFVRTWGEYGSGEGQFYLPYGIATDPRRDAVYVSEPYLSRIQVFDGKGNFIAMLGAYEAGGSARTFDELQSMVIDRHGNLYVGSTTYRVGPFGKGIMERFGVVDREPTLAAESIPAQEHYEEGAAVAIAFSAEDDWGVVNVTLRVNGDASQTRDYDHLRQVEDHFEWQAPAPGIYSLQITAYDALEQPQTRLLELAVVENAAPFVVHQGGGVRSGYVDPRMESSDGENFNLGLRQIKIAFSEPVRNVGGAGLDSSAFELSTTGGQTPGIIAVDAAANPVIVVELDAPIPVGEWTTLKAHVEDFSGKVIEDLGNLGPNMDEPDRTDIGFLPGDVNQNGEVSAQDLLHFRALLSGSAVPVSGMVQDYIDTDRNQTVDPVDLLRHRQLLTGMGAATQVWQGRTMNHPRP